MSALLIPATHDLPQAAPYWALAADGVLAVQACARCDRLYWPPRAWCSRCRCAELEPRPVSGRGRLWSFAVAHPPTLPAFAGEIPFVAALVELEEAPHLRMGGNIVSAPGAALSETDPAALAIGMALTAHFEPVREGFALPRWSPAP